MTSINTNASAMTALATLRMTNSAIDTTQDRIATGYRVNEAKDNAAYWSIATTMRSDVSSLSAVQDSLGIGASQADAASTGLTAAAETLTLIKDKLIAASQEGLDIDKVQAEISQLTSQLKGNADSAAMNGMNWLKGDATAGGLKASITSSYSRTDAGIEIGRIEIDLDSVVLYDTDSAVDLATSAYGAGIFDTELLDSADAGLGMAIGNLDISAIDLATDAGKTKMSELINAVDGKLSEIVDAASTVGAVAARLDIQSDFTRGISDALERGVGTLVDADMEEESTRLKALQTQQQLGIQALSIANSSSQNLLSLFR